MPLLKVENLRKRYEKFLLQDVSFTLEKGYIMGFIGLNGAGKTTTLKSMLNLVHPDSGRVSLLGMNYHDHELELKKEIGVIFGGMDYYTKRRVRNVTDVVRRFYPNWDYEVYADYCRLFNIDEDKKIGELSQGMRTKYALILALSHNAKLFLFDEPTSGLDPAARDDLLEIFQKLVEDGERSILFSTHITSDLEKCADYITYIHDGQIIASETREDFINSFRIVRGEQDRLTEEIEKNLIAVKKHKFGFSGLVRTADSHSFQSYVMDQPTLDEVMVFYAKKEANHGASSL